MTDEVRPAWKDTVDDMISRSEALHRSTDTLATAEQSREDPPTGDPVVSLWCTVPSERGLWECLNAYESRPGDLSEHCVDLMRWLVRRWDEAKLEEERECARAKERSRWHSWSSSKDDR